MLPCWIFPHHASLFNFSNGNDLELHVDHNRGTYEEDYKEFTRHAPTNTELVSHLGATVNYPSADEKTNSSMPSNFISESTKDVWI